MCQSPIQIMTKETRMKFPHDFHIYSCHAQSSLLWDADMHTHQTLHSSAATEVFSNRWCVSVCCQVLGMRMLVWPLLTNRYWCQTSGWDTIDHHRMLPYKYMRSHKQAQGNFIIVRIDSIFLQFEAAEKNCDSQQMALFPYSSLWCGSAPVVVWACMSSAVLLPGFSLDQWILLCPCSGLSYSPISYTGTLRVCWCLLLSRMPNKSQNTTVNIHFCYKCIISSVFPLEYGLIQAAGSPLCTGVCCRLHEYLHPRHEYGDLKKILIWLAVSARVRHAFAMVMTWNRNAIYL